MITLFNRLIMQYLFYIRSQMQDTPDGIKTSLTYMLYLLLDLRLKVWLLILLK